MAGTTDFPSERYLDLRTDHDQNMYGDVQPICGKFSALSPCHPLSFPAPQRSNHHSSCVSSSCAFMSSNSPMMATLNARRRDADSSRLGALARSHIWLARCLLRSPSFHISRLQRQTTSPATTRQPPLGNYEDRSHISAAPRGRTHRSCLLLDECPYRRRRGLYP
jgi:hypothetical protein